LVACVRFVTDYLNGYRENSTLMKNDLLPYTTIQHKAWPLAIPRIFLALMLFMFSCAEDEELEPIIDYIHIPDEVFESMLIEQNIDSDGVINQQVLISDAQSVTHLHLDFHLSKKEIQDLTGIEGFTNLTFLSASGNAIEEIDLSHNVQLDSVQLQGNYLSEIDVSHNTKLVLLDLLANELQSIHGLSNLPQLTNLNLSFNLLDTLSFESESIEAILATHNELQYFEVKNAGNLKNLNLTTNALSFLNTATLPSLETLLLSDNQFETINLEQNAQLNYLYISSNSLTSLNVSRNPNLIGLKVDRNPSLTCIRVHDGQMIPAVSLSDYQELNPHCQQ